MESVELSLALCSVLHAAWEDRCSLQLVISGCSSSKRSGAVESFDAFFASAMVCQAFSAKSTPKISLFAAKVKEISLQQNIGFTGA